MLTVAPVWSTEFITIYFVTSFATLVLCFVIGIAISQTKKTPYPTKLLCMGLLCYDGLFLSCASVAKLFPHEESFVFRHLSRGFQTAAQIIVAFMAFERLLVLNWPYIYLRASESFIRKACLCIIAVCFLHYLLIKGIGCYARGQFLGCGGYVYFPLICTIVLVSSVGVYIKIYAIIRRKVLAMNQHKGTVASFMYLLNSTCFVGLYFGLSLYNAFRMVNNCRIVQIADVVYVVICIIDPLIYGI